MKSSYCCFQTSRNLTDGCQKCSTFFLHVLQSKVRMPNILIENIWQKEKYTLYIYTFIMSVQMSLKSAFICKSQASHPGPKKTVVVTSPPVLTGLTLLPSGMDIYMATPCLPP